MITNDPISDMLTRIRNASMVRKPHVELPFSKFKMVIADILKKEGYISDVRHIVSSGDHAFDTLALELRYSGKRPMITSIKRISKPGKRVYCRKDELPIVLDNSGIAIISTPRGIMTNKQAKSVGLGGEIICEVY
ncbi:MAG: small subunit ribosomal protein S8 [Parcubacteria group bacterium Gr01-1014_18]|nr:MAG: small subunit ribosomal protein S8 [Parcubacteria group bacterium Greene0416_36]TSC80265.1 MAG: small subunit ribosomal protein S8 [Parcubacteria group bacterium Gr01-1014_18]TSC98244.1 MAG: small subunit ribosomal protein S8 [Parcubacteria group bacterium Greene1014_20]TSD07013.1 MAG: small subunit ribosomal protein S8 [Parcubacteria group bacterium Greene0714_2]